MYLAGAYFTTFFGISVAMLHAIVYGVELAFEFIKEQEVLWNFYIARETLSDMTSHSETL